MSRNPGERGYQPSQVERLAAERKSRKRTLAREAEEGRDADHRDGRLVIGSGLKNDRRR